MIPVWLEPFDPAVRDALAGIIAHPAGKLACFDADGTVWSEDIGEALFRWLAAGGLLSGIDPKRDPFDVWAEYEARVKLDRAQGYAWAVQRMAGHAEDTVRKWCRQMAVAWPNYRLPMLELMRQLAKSGVEVWLVSASNAWIIQAAAVVMGLDPARVLGIRVEVKNGVLTEAVVPPITCGAGKVEAIRARLGRAPDLAVGDGLGDREMLESARLPVAIGRKDLPPGELLRIAGERRWPTHLF